MALGTSPISLPQSCSGRLLVIIVDRVSYRRRMISNKNSPERLGRFFIPMSSTISRSGLRYFASAFSCPSNASSCKKSRTRSKIDRYRTRKPCLIA